MERRPDALRERLLALVELGLARSTHVGRYVTYMLIERGERLLTSWRSGAWPTGQQAVIVDALLTNWSTARAMRTSAYTISRILDSAASHGAESR